LRLKFFNILIFFRFRKVNTAAQQFKVSSIGFISPDEKDKSGPVFLEKAAEDIPQRTKEIVLAARPVPGRPVLLIPQK
jgi:hypothetical protein